MTVYDAQPIMELVLPALGPAREQAPEPERVRVPERVRAPERSPLGRRSPAPVHQGWSRRWTGRRWFSTAASG